MSDPGQERDGGDFARRRGPFSYAPPSRTRTDETHSFAIARDGTRLFVRSKYDPSGDAGGLTSAVALRAFLCDGIACDGFIWKYLWDDLSKVVPVTHWNYRGHGRSAPPADPDRIDITAHGDDLSTVRRSMGDPPC